MKNTIHACRKNRHVGSVTLLMLLSLSFGCNRSLKDTELETVLAMTRSIGVCKRVATGNPNIAAFELIGPLVTNKEIVAEWGQFVQEAKENAEPYPGCGYFVHIVLLDRMNRCMVKGDIVGYRGLVGLEVVGENERCVLDGKTIVRSAKKEIEHKSKVIQSKDLCRRLFEFLERENKIYFDQQLRTYGNGNRKDAELMVVEGVLPAS